MSDAQIVVFEPMLEGHRHEHIRLLAEGWAEADPPARLMLLVPDAPERWDAVAGMGHPKVALSPLTPREVRRCAHPNWAIRALRQWEVLQARVATTGAEHALCMHLDTLQLPLALRQSAGHDARLSGILFRPSLHYPTLSGAPPQTARERIRDWSKGILLRGALRNPTLSSVLALDSQFASYARAHLPAPEKTHHLPEPGLFPGTEASRALELPGWLEAVPQARVCFTLFGHLARRKGILQALEALTRLDDQTARQTAVILAGVVDPPFRSTLEGRIDDVRRRVPGVWLHLEDRWLGRSEITALLRVTQVVLAPYQRFIGSSGVCFWAAGAKRPMIAQDYGMLGWLTREHGLGLTVDTRDPAQIAEAMARSVRSRGEGLCNPEKMAALARANTPQDFARTLVEHTARQVSSPTTG